MKSFDHVSPLRLEGGDELLWNLAFRGALASPDPVVFLL